MPHVPIADDDSVQVYLREACADPPLTEQEEIDFSRRLLAREGPAEPVRLRLLQGNLANVVAIARRYAGRGKHVLHLAQIGNKALLAALDTYSGNSGETFSTYAASRVEAAISKSVR